MAFDQSTRVAVFELDMHRYPGLVIRVRRPSFRAMRTLLRAEQRLGVGLQGELLAGAERVEAWAEVVDAFAESLVDWTLLDFGTPVPATRDGVLGQDYEFLIVLVRAWYGRVVLLAEPTPAAEIAEPADEEDDTEDLLAELPVTTLPASAAENPAA